MHVCLVGWQDTKKVGVLLSGTESQTFDRNEIVGYFYFILFSFIFFHFLFKLY